MRCFLASLYARHGPAGGQVAVTSGTEMLIESTVWALFRRFVTGGTAVAIGALFLTACVSGSSESVLPRQTDDDAAAAASNTSGDGADGDGDDFVDLDDDSLAGTVRPADAGLSITITRVSDGDSVRADSAEGDLEIRLIGINAPEQDECFGSEAAAALESLLEGTDVTLHPWPGETDDFGRQLGFLVTEDLFVNLALIESGHVVARAQSDHGFDREFEDAEQQASSRSAGLWAADACGAPTDADLRIVEVFEDAPGDDRANPNGEYVVIVNEGDADVALDGWAIRDESTRHRFSFPNMSAPPEIEIIIRTGCGDNSLDTDPIEVFWCDPEPPVWNNGGDTAFLLDPNGAIADNYVVQG